MAKGFQVGKDRKKKTDEVRQRLSCVSCEKAGGKKVDENHIDLYGKSVNFLP